MARITQFFHTLQPLFRHWLSFGRSSVDDQQQATWTQHPESFTEKILHAGKVMRRHPAGDEPERSVGIGQRFRRVLPRGDVQPALRGQLAHLFEHSLRNVRRRHRHSAFRQIGRGMSRARRDVECRRKAGGIESIQRRRHVGHIAQDVSAAVARGLAVELRTRGLDRIAHAGVPASSSSARRRNCPQAASISCPFSRRMVATTPPARTARTNSCWRASLGRSQLRPSTVL